VQLFCGEAYFQHALPLDRSSMTRWRQRIGAERLELLLAESLAAAQRGGTVGERHLRRVTIDTSATRAPTAVIRRSPDGLSREVPEARLWAVPLAAIPAALGLLLATGIARPDLAVVVGLAVFGFAFAVNSSLHSYLILAYAGSEKAAEDVGYYYAANAAGRLLGILLSGVLTHQGGLEACLWGSAAMLAACAALTFLLPTEAAARRVPL
jgi:MFS family permease